MSGWRVSEYYLHAPPLFVAGRRLRTRLRLAERWQLRGWVQHYPEGNVYTLRMGPVLMVFMVEWWYA